MSVTRLFGTDGVRGRANEDLTPELALDLARAAGEDVDGSVVIGRDTRRSGSMLAAALHAGFNSMGLNTIDVGIVPAGAVSRIARDTGSCFGVVVSASHNPALDNGIKFFGEDGSKLSDDREGEIEERYWAKASRKQADGATVGIRSCMGDALERYVNCLVADSLHSLHGLNFVLDCAQGAAFKAAPEVFNRLGASVDAHNTCPDGMNINDGCGATHPEYLASVSDGRVGFAFDGDADRCVAIDEDGATVDGDAIMAILARHMKESGRLTPPLVVATVMSNLGFRKAMAELDIKVKETLVGDRYVLEEMRATGAMLGGEQSGHVILEDRTTGDGLRTALRIAEVLAESGRELRDLRTVMTRYPQVQQNILVSDRDDLGTADDVWRAVRAAEAQLGDEGRILVRASGTEPLVRVMVEAATENSANRTASEIAKAVQVSLG